MNRQLEREIKQKKDLEYKFLGKNNKEKTELEDKQILEKDTKQTREIEINLQNIKEKLNLDPNHSLEYQILQKTTTKLIF